MKIDDFVFVIPSYCPSPALIDQVESLQELHFKNIIVINDGSPERDRSIFNQLKNCTILTLNRNQGKGSALKFAFNFILEQKMNCRYVITSDDDGQHLPSDIYNVVLQASELECSSLIIGARDFSGKIPMKSKIGNTIMRLLVLVIWKVNLVDTQSGLRAYPIETLKDLTLIKGERFDFEFQVLIYFMQNKLPIKSVLIKTIYFMNNKLTRFKPVQDSLNVFSAFLKNWLL